jgi:uncharacterized membrane protein
MSTPKQEYSRHVSAPPDESVRIDNAITIDRPVSEVYSFWRQFENLPRFMRHLESVTIQDDLHSHWVAKTFGGRKLEWDAVVSAERENEMISWHSLPGADIDNGGSVWLTPVADGTETEVRLELKYVPPGGKTAAFVSKLFRKDANTEIVEDLKRLKTLLETGQLLESDAMRWHRRTIEFTRKGADAADGYIRENPWVTAACVAIGCFALGFLLGQRTDVPKLDRRLTSA